MGLLSTKILCAILISPTFAAFISLSDFLSRQVVIICCALWLAGGAVACDHSSESVRALLFRSSGFCWLLNTNESAVREVPSVDCDSPAA
jgi:hypothetical protein